MKQFIARVTVFLLFFACFLVLTDIGLSTYIQMNADLKTRHDIEYIVLGHSHPECAFDDEKIGKLKNFASSGEAYFYTYVKMIQLLERNKNVRVVFLEFSGNQIRQKMDKWTWGRKYLSQHYPLYGPFLDLNEKFFLFIKNTYEFINIFSVSLRNMLRKTIQSDLSYSNSWGGYLHLERNRIHKLLKKKGSPGKKKNNKGDEKVSQTNIRYLIKIIEKAVNEYGVELFLIRSPIHPQSPELNNQKKYFSVLDTVLSDYQTIEFLDFSGFPLHNDQYGDFGHLNYKGAAIFSEWFNRLLENGLLKKQDKQQFINKKCREESNNGTTKTSRRTEP